MNDVHYHKEAQDQGWGKGLHWWAHSNYVYMDKNNWNKWLLQMLYVNTSWSNLVSLLYLCGISFKKKNK